MLRRFVGPHRAATCQMAVRRRRTLVAAAAARATAERSSITTANSNSSQTLPNASTSSSSSNKRRKNSKTPLPPAPSPRLPTRHSRTRLPAICTDPVELHEETQAIMQAPMGTLFTYQVDQNSRDAAWEQAYLTVQKVEYLMRGHSYALPGTQWQRWGPPQQLTSTRSASPPDKMDANTTLQHMLDLLYRIWDEGHVYIELRASRMLEYQILNDHTTRTSTMVPTADIVTMMQDWDEDENGSTGDDVIVEDLDSFFKEGGFALDLDGSPAMNDVVEGKESLVQGENDTEPTDLYLHDFAAPGPTIAMSGILLDAMACQAGHANLVTPDRVNSHVQQVLHRHYLDSGGDANTNTYTRLNVLPFNAAMRTATTLPYDATDHSAGNRKFRDTIVALSLAAFDAIHHETCIQRNSASYTYLLHMIARMFPASRVRGHMAHGMMHHVLSYGLLDADVLAAYHAANTPSNGDEFEAWRQQCLEQPMELLPQKWKRYANVFRYHPRENVY